MRFHKSPAGATLWAHATVRQAADGDHRVVHGDLRVFDDTGDLISETLDARLRYLDDAAGREMLGAPDDLFYEVAWEAHALESAGERASPEGRWLVFADRTGVGAALAAARPESVLVEAGERFFFDGTRATIRVNNDDDYRELFRLAGAFTAIVHLWAVDTTVGEFDDLTGALAIGPASVVRVVQAVMSSSRQPRPRIWIVSAGAQAAVEADLVSSPAGATVWGIGRTLAAEHAELWGGLIDLDLAASRTTTVGMLAREVAESDAEDSIAYRGDQRLVARLRHQAMETPADRFSPDGGGTYLVTGGLGGVGLAMARWLVGEGVRHLLVLGRTPLPPRQAWGRIDVGSSTGLTIAAILAMEAEGARVETAALDVAAIGPLKDCIDGRRASGEPPIRGVIHAAGIVESKALIEQDQPGLVKLFAGKVVGAWNLHRLLGTEPLDCFVLCSSASAIFGRPFLGGYAAANSFLDSLAHYRRKRGETVLSVNWGPWRDVGMAVREGRNADGDMARGVGALSTARGLDALEVLICNGATHSVVIPINWGELFRSYPALAANPFYREMARWIFPAVASESKPTFSLVAFHHATPAVRRDLVGGYLRTEAARVVGLTAATIDSATPLSSLGFDSLMAVQLKNRIETDLKVVVQMVQFLQGPSVDQLTGVVLDAVRAAGPDVAVKSAPTTGFEEGSL
jgi:phthiocerol/phenolphthiocerol synthesis type-I polyketide synthase D